MVEVEEEALQGGAGSGRGEIDGEASFRGSTAGINAIGSLREDEGATVSASRG